MLSKITQGQQTECVFVGNIKSFVSLLVVQINYSCHCDLLFTILSCQTRSTAAVFVNPVRTWSCVTFDLQLCEYYDCGWSKSNICNTFSVTKTISCYIYIYQKYMSVGCKLYFQYLHIKKQFEKKNYLALSCLRTMYTCL